MEEVRVGYRVEDGVRLASVLWQFGPGWRMISSAVLGGGIGPRAWVLNAQVPGGYARMDPAEHLAALAPAGEGVGMMTAARADRYVTAEDGGVRVLATVGLGVPTWAAAPEGGCDDVTAGAPDSASGGAPDGRVVPGTVNIVIAVPVAMTDAALVNAVMTATEAKSQALIEMGLPCTGTASDALCVAVRAHGPPEPFAGPRSRWGSRLARAVHRAVRRGAADWLTHAAGAGGDGSSAAPASP